MVVTQCPNYKAEINDDEIATMTSEIRLLLRILERNKTVKYRSFIPYWVYQRLCIYISDE